MSLIDLASLVLAPTATKEGKVYSAIPDTGEGDMTFTRGSSATRVNSAGLIEKERANFLLQSNTFDTTWFNTSSTETGGQSGYDGSNNAWLLSKSALGGKIRQNISVSGVKTFSLYSKANASNWIAITFNTAQSFAYFDLSSGALGSAGTEIIDYNIQSVGGDWYRVSLSTAISQTAIDIYVADGNNDVTGTSGSIYIQDAMLNEGLVAQPYIPTTTTAVYEGITDDVPRVDYSGGGCPSLLLEGQRSNLAVYSEYIGSAWNPYGNISIATNAATSPEGVQNATEISAASTTTASIGIQDGFAVTANTDYTISFFAKKGDFRYIQLFHGGSQVTSNPRTNFDIQEGVVAYEESGVVTAIVEDYGNGWYRCTATMEALLTNLQAYIAVVPNADAARGESISATAGENYYIYGIQIEEGSYVSSYLPTYGTSTTRVADSCSKTGISSLLNPSEGAVFLEINTFDNGTTSKVFTIGDGTGNRIQVFYYEDSIRLNFTSGGTSYAYFNHALTDVNDIIKVAVSYANNDIRMYVNGVLTNSDTSATMPSTLSYARFDNGSGGSLFYGNIKQSLIFPTALTNTQLQELTK